MYCKCSAFGKNWHYFLNEKPHSINHKTHIYCIFCAQPTHTISLPNFYMSLLATVHRIWMGNLPLQIGIWKIISPLFKTVTFPLLIQRLLISYWLRIDSNLFTNYSPWLFNPGHRYSTSVIQKRADIAQSIQGYAGSIAFILNCVFFIFCF